MKLERHIVLTGFMGAGKTTVGRALAAELGCKLIDLDRVISERANRTIRSLIDEEGEAAFRLREAETLRDVLRRNPASVIALGGGAWTIERNRQIIAEHNCATVWLDASFELCWRRITTHTHGANIRPLARDRERAHKLYEQRQAVYRLAQLHIAVDETRGIEELTETIIYEINGND